MDTVSFDRIVMPLGLMDSLLKHRYDHRYEFSGRFLGVLENNQVYIKTLLFEHNLLLNALEDKILFSEVSEWLGSLYLRQHKTWPKAAPENLYFMLKDHNLSSGRSILEMAEREFSHDDLRKWLQELAQGLSAPSLKQPVVFGDENLYQGLKKDSPSAVVCYCHSHPFPNPILPSCTDINLSQNTPSLLIQIQESSILLISYRMKEGSGDSFITLYGTARDENLITIDVSKSHSYPSYVARNDKWRKEESEKIPEGFQLIMNRSA